MEANSTNISRISPSLQVESVDVKGDIYRELAAHEQTQGDELNGKTTVDNCKSAVKDNTNHNHTNSSAPTCFQCGKLGHIARLCPFRSATKKKNSVFGHRHHK